MRSPTFRAGLRTGFTGQLPLLTAALLAIGAGIAAPAACAPVPGPVVAAGSGSYRQGLPDASETDASWRKPSQITAWGPGGVPVYGPAVPHFKGVGATSSQWWSGLAWHYWGTQASGLKSVPNYAWPMAFQTKPDGVGIWTPNAPSIARDNGGNFDWMAGTPIDGVDFLGGDYQVSKYQHMYDQDMVAGLEGLASSDPFVTGYSDWGVTAEWSSGTSKLEVTSATGSPFMYFKRTAGSANAKIEITGGLTVWANNGNVLGITVSKAAANYRPGSSHHYALFAPSGAAWVQNGSTFSAPLGTKGYFSVAALPAANAATLADFQGVAYNFITGTRFGWSYNEEEATLTSTFNVSTRNMETGALNGPTLTGIFPHAWKNNLNNPVNTAYTYQGANGLMKVVRGNEFSTQMRFTGLLPTLPVTAGMDQARLNGWINEVANDPAKLWQTPPEGSKDDVYWNGRSLGRLVELLELAVQTGNTVARDKLLSELKPNLQNWLSYNAGANEANRFYAYDPTWRTLCPAFDVHFSCRDLSDHHFINGYYIRAAAAIAMHDPNGAAWVASYGPMIEHLVKDPFNYDRNDTQYPFLRHYSPMDGHTWAGGISFGDGLNEESSSEAINFASALVLYGSATGNKTLRDLGIMHYTNQSRAIEEYVFDVDGDNFPAEYKPNNAGMVWSNGRVHGTWWTAEPRAVLGINLLPIQPGSVYLGRRTEGITAQIAQMMAYQQTYAALPDSARGPKLIMGPNDWSDLWWSYKALVDADGAALDFEAGLAHAPEFGNTKADTYAWIYSLKTLGRLETGVSANVPTYNVFNKNGVKHYAAYNPGLSEKCVTFSDGRAMLVPARKMVLDGASITCGGSSDLTAPSVPASLALSNVGANGMTVSWAASSDNTGGSGMAGYNVYRAKAGSAAVLAGSPAGTSFTDSGLTPSTDYVYSVAARDVAGNTSAASAGVQGRTLAGSDVTAPANPASVSVGGATASSLVVSWSAASDNAGGSGMAGYDILRGSVKVGSVGAAVLSFTDSGLAASTPYTYVVKARDVAGNLSGGASASGSTVAGGVDVTPPAVPQLTLAAVGSNSMSIQWNLVSDNPGGKGMAGYDIQRYGGTIASVGANVSTFTDQNLNLNTPYGYTVKARDLAGNLSAASNQVEGRTGQGTPDTTAPSVVTGLAAGSVTSSGVTLNWNASSDNSGGSGMAGYDVYRNAVKVGAASGTSYTDAGLAAASTYSYTVRARDVAGNAAAAGTPVSVTTLSGPTGVDARTNVQAESFAARDPRIVLVAGGTAVGGTHNGSWIKLAGVNFGTVSPTGFTVNVASGLAGSASISVYKGSISAANRIGTMGVGSTGGWSTWKQIPMNLGAGVTGTHDIIIEFSSPYTDPNGLAHLDWIRFH